MQYTLTDNDSTIYIRGRRNSNLRFADNIDHIAGSSNELKKLTDSIDKSSSKNGVEINPENSDILVNEPDPKKVNSNNITINMYVKN